MVTSIDNYDEVFVFVGLDVGKGEHHAVALDKTGKRLLDKALPNDETKLRAVLTQLQRHGLVLLVVDQPATIGATTISPDRSPKSPTGSGVCSRRSIPLWNGYSGRGWIIPRSSTCCSTTRHRPHCELQVRSGSEPAT